MRTELAKRTVTTAFYLILGGIISFIFVIVTASEFDFNFSIMNTDDISSLWILAGISLSFFLFSIPAIYGPKVLIEYDEKGIYLKRFKRSDIFVAFHNIIDVESYLSSTRQYGKLHTFGTLYVKTKEIKHTIHHIEELEKVKNELNLLIEKFKSEA